LTLHAHADDVKCWEQREIAARVSETGQIGIACDDPIHSRLLDSATVHLGMKPVLLDTASLTQEVVAGLEVIVTERVHADALIRITRSPERVDDPYRPAILVITATETNFEDENNEPFDGVMPLPQSPAAVASLLSIALYAHRAFARRFESALEELHMNRQIFHSVTNGISVANATLPDMPLTYVNPAFEVMTGYSLEDVMGKNCRFLQHGETDQPSLVLIREAIRDGREVVATIRNYRRDGKPFWNELTLSPIRDREGKVVQFVGIQADVTERVEIENALRESEKLAVAGRLAASIAHEINNPLESVTNLVYIAEHSETLEEAREYLHQVDGELRRIKLITSQSLRFYKQSTRPQAVLLSDLVTSALDMAAARMSTAHVQVERRDRLHRHIVCMESEIRQVINNLIGNATDAMRAQGGGRLLIRTHEGTEAASGREGAFLTVADTGMGIPRAALRDIYRAFYSTKGIQGTGLGLWISREIVGRHYGRMFVRSNDGTESHGTIFRLFLPFQGVTVLAD
jgi:two-component system sporulation sensor kinase C